MLPDSKFESEDFEKIRNAKDFTKWNKQKLQNELKQMIPSDPSDKERSSQFVGEVNETRTDLNEESMRM